MDFLGDKSLGTINDPDYFAFSFSVPQFAWVTEKLQRPSLRQTISHWRTMILPIPGHLQQVHHLSAPQMAHGLKHPQCVFIIKPKWVMIVEMARQTVNKNIAWTLGLDSYFLDAAPGSLWDCSEATEVSGPLRCDSCPLPGRDVQRGMEPCASGTPGPFKYQHHRDGSIACCCVPHFELQCRYLKSKTTTLGEIMRCPPWGQKGGASSITIASS